MVSWLWLMVGNALAWEAGPPDDRPTGVTSDTGVAGCNTQQLTDGVQIPNGDLVFRWRPSISWGTPRLVDTLLHAAGQVAWHVPGADPLIVGDMSRQTGGRLAGHKSHRGGLDADIGIYWGDAQQGPGGLQTVVSSIYDPKANWVLIRSLLESGNVERILLDRSLIKVQRRYLLKELGMTSDEVYALFPVATTGVWGQTGVVHHADGHKNHMHVRTHCD